MASNVCRARRSSPAPWIREWLASTCSISVVPERGKPKTNTGRRVGARRRPVRREEVRPERRNEAVDKALVLGRDVGTLFRRGPAPGPGRWPAAGNRRRAAIFAPAVQDAGPGRTADGARGPSPSLGSASVLQGRQVGVGQLAAQQRRQPGVRQGKTPAASARRRGTPLRPRPARPCSSCNPPRFSWAAARSGCNRSAVAVMLGGLGRAGLLLAMPSPGRGGPPPVPAPGRAGPFPAGNGLGELFPLRVQLGQVLPKGRRCRAPARPPASARPGRRRAGLPAARPVPGGRATWPDWGPAESLPGRRPWHRRIWSECQQGVAQVVVQRRQVRLQANGFLAVRQRFLGLAAINQHLAQVGPGRRRSRGPARRHGGSASAPRRICPSSRRLMPRLLWASREVGPQLQGRGGTASTASACRPSPCRARPRLQWASG